MAQTRGSSVTGWIHATASVLVGAGAMLMLGVQFFSATTAGAIAIGVALVGLVVEAKNGDTSPRRTFHLAGLLMGLAAAVLAQIVPGLFLFAAM
ncbi:hypothetical protein [Streptomyces indicus]|uniref:Uncharacterized protein n=1 Tax=Streptomyces indicus TaxID=417292 RepID=A0A1G9ARV3_9ACTN|nr:hypothetical protein [Streptomyces indicus]SDK29997.1 hypothetical protein SAMN05421806_106117 [Streptomyces indicus]